MLDQGRAAEAEAELRSVLAVRERTQGPESEDTLSTRHELARALMDQGRLPEAELELRNIRAIEERLGRADDDALVVRYSLARAVVDQGRGPEVLDEIRAIAQIEESGGPPDGSAYMTRGLLAEAALQAGDTAEADRILKTIPESPQGEGWRRRWTASLAFARARVADALGDHDQGAAWIAKAKELYATIYPADHWDIQRIEAYASQRR
jgi:ATP/maltotriose-dependent transcriptional regulator MalT